MHLSDLRVWGFSYSVLGLLPRPPRRNLDGPSSALAGQMTGFRGVATCGKHAPRAGFRVSGEVRSRPESVWATHGATRSVRRDGREGRTESMYSSRNLRQVRGPGSGRREGSSKRLPLRPGVCSWPPSARASRHSTTCRAPPENRSTIPPWKRSLRALVEEELPHALPRNGELGPDLRQGQALPVALVHRPETPGAFAGSVLSEGH
jgi:hypothetical protein